MDTLHQTWHLRQSSNAGTTASASIFMRHGKWVKHVPDEKIS